MLRETSHNCIAFSVDALVDGMLDELIDEHQPAVVDYPSSLSAIRAEIRRELRHELARTRVDLRQEVNDRLQARESRRKLVPLPLPSGW